MTMIESVLHLFKIHRKMIFGNASVVVQNMLRKTPEPLNAVNVIPGSSVYQRLFMRDGMVLAESLEGVVASEGVGVVDRTLSGFLSDNGHKFFFSHMLHDSRVHFAVALQKAKYNVLSARTSSTLALAPDSKVALVHFYFSVQFAALKLRNMVNRFSEFLVDTGNGLVVGAKVVREAVGRLLLVEPLHDGNFHSDALQRLLFFTGLVPAPDVPPTGSRHLERTAKNTLLTPRKVSRATENVLPYLCHMDILLPYGYETP